MRKIRTTCLQKFVFLFLVGKFLFLFFFGDRASLWVHDRTSPPPPQHDYYTFSRTERPSDHQHVIILFCAASRAFSYLNNVVSCVCVCVRIPHTATTKKCCVCVCCYTSKVSFYLSVSFFAKPKSVIFKCPSRSSRRFSGFRSR